MNLNEAALMVMMSGPRRDLDIRPLYLFAGLDKNRLDEVYQGYRSKAFSISDKDNQEIHESLKTDTTHPSVIHYSGQGAIAINRALWENHLNGTPVPKDHIEHIKNIDKSLIFSTDLKKPIKLYSGMPISPAATSAMEWNSTRAKKIIHLPAYTSATPIFSNAVNFTGVDSKTVHHESVHHGIVLPKARHIIEMHFDDKIRRALSLKNHSYSPEEDEVLLGRNYMFELHPRPKQILHEYAHPVYIWEAHQGAMDTGKDSLK